jgi:hypothetical protein
MVNYQNTKIYKIESHLGDKIYIGSTTKEYLSQRMVTHKSGYRRWKNGVTKAITMSYLVFDEYGIDNCSIVLLESFPCNSKDEAHSKEAHYIKTLDCVNKNIPNRTKKEWRDEHKEVQKAHNSKYYESNKEKHIEAVKNYQELHREAINEKHRKKYDEKNGPKWWHAL